MERAIELSAAERCILELIDDHISNNKSAIHIFDVIDCLRVVDLASERKRALLKLESVGALRGIPPKPRIPGKMIIHGLEDVTSAWEICPAALSLIEQLRQRSPSTANADKLDFSETITGTPLAVRDLLGYLGFSTDDKTVDNAEARLRRLRDKDLGCYTETYGPARREARYLYHPEKVKATLEGLKRASNVPRKND